MKKCYKCKKEYGLDFFSKDKYREDGFTIYCKNCVREYKIKRGYTEKARLKRKEDYYKDIEKSRKIGRETQMKRLYGITKEQFDKLVEEQNGQCFICDKKPKRLYIDHNHTTKKIRKLLCLQCNSGLGMFKEDIITLKRAIKYVEFYGSR